MWSSYLMLRWAVLGREREMKVNFFFQQLELPAWLEVYI